MAPTLSRTRFAIPGMDCPSEERLVRMALDGVPGVAALDFDLDARRLVVVHEGEAGPLLGALEPLGFGARIEDTAPLAEGEMATAEVDSAAAADERRVLRQVLAINAAMFLVELVLGFVARSTGLIADSLDNLADAMVYALSLYVVGRVAGAQTRAARAAGLLQLVLALGALGEVVRRAVVGGEPVGALMIGVAFLALVANLTSVALLARHRKGGVHLRASWIFTTNDALANLGVIVAGVLVGATGSPVPDLVVGTAVALAVLVGAVRILRLRT